MAPAEGLAPATLFAPAPLEESGLHHTTWEEGLLRAEESDSGVAVFVDSSEVEEGFPFGAAGGGGVTMECGSVIVDAQGDPFALALARGAARGEVLTLVGEGEEEVTLRAAAGEVAPALRALVLGGPLVAVSRAGQGHGLRMSVVSCCRRLQVW